MVYKAIDSKEETRRFLIFQKSNMKKRISGIQRKQEVETEAVEAKEIKIIGEISVDEDIKKKLK